MKMFLRYGMKTILLTVAAFLMLMCSLIGHAQVVTFQLYKVVLSDGSSATGSFDYDFGSGNAANIGIVAGNGYFNNSSYASTDVTSEGISGTYDTVNTSDNLNFTFINALDPLRGATFATTSSMTIDNGTGFVTTLTVVSGSVLPISSLPTTTATLAGPSNANGWYKGSVTVTLKAQTGVRPLAATYYKLDNGAATRYSVPFTVSGEATHTLTLWSTDTSGFSETAHAVTIGIDATPPVTGGWHTGQAVTLSPTDAVSGVARTYYTVNGGPKQTYTTGFIAPIGADTVTYWSVDNAGNTEVPHTLAFTTGDTVPPTAPGAPHFVSKTSTTTTVAWTASTDNVGVAGYHLFRFWGRSGRGGGFGWILIGTTTSTQISVSATLTTNTLGVQAYDAAGNKSTIVVVH